MWVPPAPSTGGPLRVPAACGYRVAALAVNRSVELVEEQAGKFRPELVAASDESAEDPRLADTPLAGGNPLRFPYLQNLSVKKACASMK